MEEQRPENTHQVFTAVPGAVIRLGNLGECSNDTPCLVPEAVALELSGSPEFRVEPIPPPAAPAELPAEAAPAEAPAEDKPSRSRRKSATEGAEE